LRDPCDPPFDETNVRWRGPEFGIGDKFRLDQFDDLAPSLDRARSRGKDFLTHCTSDP
jgi:hypothetical protein